MPDTLCWSSMSPRFEYVAPDQVRVGDIIMCYMHDDQHECANARVIAIERDDKPGVLAFSVGGSDYRHPYEYQLWLTCRHISLKRLDATGGPEYRWHRFPWNGVTRYVGIE